MTDATTVVERSSFAYGSAVKAGLIAGAIFMALEMLLVWLAMGMSPFAPPQMIAAIAMGPEVLPGPDNPAGSNLGVLLVGMAVHFALSVVLAFVFKYIAGAMRLHGPMLLLAGVAFGLIVYAVHFYGLTALFPWFAMARNWISVLAHAIFGLVLAYAMMPRTLGTVREQPI